jgi:hypothetical protein
MSDGACPCAPVGDHRLGRQALDQPFRRRRLDRRLFAGTESIFGTMRHDHPELRRSHVEPLRGLLANHMHGRAAAGAVGVFRGDRHIDARQMGRKRTAIDAALVAARPCGHASFLSSAASLPATACSMSSRAKATARNRASPNTGRTARLQSAQQVPQAIHLRQRLVAFGNRRIPLRAHHRDQRMQRVDVGRKLICDLARAASCDAVSRITPSLIGDHRKAPGPAVSTTEPGRFRPSTIFSRSARFDRR